MIATPLSLQLFLNACASYGHGLMISMQLCVTVCYMDVLLGPRKTHKDFNIEQLLIDKSVSCLIKFTLMFKAVNFISHVALYLAVRGSILDLNQLTELLL